MPPVKLDQAEPAPVARPPVEEVEETWEEKEDKLDAENIQPQSPAPATPTEQKYQYKEGVFLMTLKYSFDYKNTSYCFCINKN